MSTKKKAKTSANKSESGSKQEILLHLPIKTETTDTNAFIVKTDSVITNFVQQVDSSYSNELDELREEIKTKDKLIRQLKDELLYRDDLDRKSWQYHQASLVNSQTGELIKFKKTKNACWWCAHSFDTVQCYIPEQYYNNRYYVFGCFCSYSCASAYNLNINDYKTHERHNLIKQLYNTITNTTEDIRIALQKEVLVKFGGVMSIEEYRKNAHVVHPTNIKLQIPPIVYITPRIETEDKPIEFKDQLHSDC